MTNADKLTMLYQIANGIVEMPRYGLTLAHIAGLPSAVLDTANKVSKTLTTQMAARKRSPQAVALAKRRKLVLNLREALLQVHD